MTHATVHPLVSPWGRFGLHSYFIDAPEPAIVDTGIASSPAEGMVPALEAFGRSIGSFQNTRFALATATTEVEVAREFVDRCVAEHVTGDLSPIDAPKAKWWSSDMQGRVIDACVQIYGGYGYMAEYDVARAWTDARVTRIWGGTNEIMKEVIGRDLGFGDPRPVG